MDNLFNNIFHGHDHGHGHGHDRDGENGDENAHTSGLCHHVQDYLDHLEMYKIEGIDGLPWRSVDEGGFQEGIEAIEAGNTAVE